MIKTIKSGELKVGMYVILPGGWLGHGFLTGEFLLKHRKEIDRIIAQGINLVKIDRAKSDPASLADLDRPDKTHADSVSTTQSIVPTSLVENLNDSSSPPEIQAQRIRESAELLMQQLLESPTAENIAQAKQAIYSITDYILGNDETTSFLIRITSRDYYTYTHSVNVGVLAIALAKEIYQGKGEHNLRELGAGFFLHDLGKVRIDQAIINKQGKLTDEEMSEMRKHPSRGFSLLAQTHQLTEECKHIVWQHHERYDGTGYPQGLAGEDIHEYAKICALADVYDALTAERSYKKALSPFSALDLMRRQMLSHFRKDLFDKFVLMLA